MRRLAPFFALTLCWAAVAAPSWGSTFVAMTQRQLVAQADSIIVGRVMAVEPYWDHEHGIIVTEAVIEVERALVGEAPDVVRVKTWGGHIGNAVIEAAGVPRFQEGERQLLFLVTRPGEEVPVVLGYQQGQYRIDEAPDGTEVARSAVEEGTVIVGPDGRPVSLAGDLPLERLEQQIGDLARHVRPVTPRPVLPK